MIRGYVLFKDVQFNDQHAQGFGNRHALSLALVQQGVSISESAPRSQRRGRRCHEP